MKNDPSNFHCRVIFIFIFYMESYEQSTMQNMFEMQKWTRKKNHFINECKIAKWNKMCTTLYKICDIHNNSLKMVCDWISELFFLTAFMVHIERKKWFIAASKTLYFKRQSALTCHNFWIVRACAYKKKWNSCSPQIVNNAT